MSHRVRRDRWRAASRWLGVPWSEMLLAGTALAAAMAPVFLVVTADVWRADAEDEVTARTVAGAPLDRNGIDIAHEVRFDDAGIARADAAVRVAISDIPELDVPDLTIYTLLGLVTIDQPPRQVGPSGRLVAREGAIEAIEVVEQLADTDDGVFVSTWFADRHDLELGDLLGFEAGAIVDEAWNDTVQGGGASGSFPIIGLYEPLWSADDTFALPPYWADAPPEIIPTYVDAFGGPNAELVIADRSIVVGSGLTGIARWRAALTGLPDDFDGLADLTARMRRLELDLVRDGELGAAIIDIATVSGGRPRLGTELFDTASTVADATRRFDAPLGSARAIGVALGLVAMAGVGWFFVERRRAEFTLLTSEGERWPKLTTRVALQLLPTTLLGSALGVMGAVIGLWLLGPTDEATLAPVRWQPVVAVTAGSWLVAACVAGWHGVRSAHARARRPGRAATAAVAIGLAAPFTLAWLQVERTTTAAGTDVDLTVVALPVLGVLLAVAIGTAATAASFRAGARWFERSPVPIALAAHRIGAGTTGVRLVAGGFGLGVGLLLFSVTLTSTLDRTIEVKLASRIGGESSITLVDRLPPDTGLPTGTTLVRSFDSVLTPGGGRVRVIAIDGATWPAAVSWPDSFGGRADDVPEKLTEPVAGGVAAVGVNGQGTPRVGAFGLTRTFGFEIVDRVDSFPGAGTSATSLLIDARALDELAAGEEGYPTLAAALADGFRPPTDRFVQRLVSQDEIDDLTAVADSLGLRVRDPVSRDQEAGDPAVVAARAAFGYLAVLGIVAAAAALIALGLFLESQRRSRALTGVIVRSMGVPPWQAALITTIELATTMSVAVVGSLVAVPFVVGRVAPRFDPAPDVPPTVGALIDWTPLIAGSAAAIVVVSAAVWSTEWRAGHRPAGEAVRDAG